MIQLVLKGAEGAHPPVGEKLAFPVGQPGEVVVAVPRRNCGERGARAEHPLYQLSNR